MSDLPDSSSGFSVGPEGEMQGSMDSLAGWQRVGDAQELLEGGDGLRFELERSGLDPLAAFCVRFEGRVCAFLNRCAHVPVELDWQPGKFFDDTGLYLICATHGAMYKADTGACIAGPCRGQSLRALMAKEEGKQIWVKMATTPHPEKT
jgi:nitrite reductase/ring-hydroxylating ferredoxin subunit